METRVVTAPTPSHTAVESVTRWSEEIKEIDRLCFIGTATLLAASRGSKKGVFFGTLTSDRRPASGFHSTITAQCVAALRAVVRFADLLRPPSDSQIDEGELPQKLKDEIENQLKRFSGRGCEADILATLSSLVYGELNALTCAHVLRVLAPSLNLVEPAWIIALFAILWSLDRSVPSPDEAHGATIGDRRPTALATDKCVEAIELIIEVLQRRSNRLTGIRDLIKDLQDLETIEQDATRDFWLAHQQRLVQQKLHDVLRDATQNVAVHELFENWFKALERDLLTTPVSTIAISTAFRNAVRADLSDKQIKKISAQFETVLAIIREYYVDPLSELTQHLNTARDLMGDKTSTDNNSVIIKKDTNINTIVDRVKDIGKTIFNYWNDLVSATLTKLEDAKDIIELTGDKKERNEFLAKMLVAIDPHFLDQRLPVARIDETKSVLGDLQTFFKKGRPSCGRDELLRDIDRLRNYWSDMERSAQRANHTCELIKRYIVDEGLQQYVEFSNCSNAGSSSLIDTLNRVVTGLDDVREVISRRIEPTLTWARSKMARQLAHATSDAVSRFDPAELAYAARTCLRFKEVRNVDVIFKAVETVCSSQRPDGSWSAQRPFVWGERGFAAYPHSTDVALALVSTIRELVRVPERFGVTQKQMIHRTASIDEALYRARESLSQSVQKVDPGECRDWNRSDPRRGSQKGRIQHQQTPVEGDPPSAADHEDAEWPEIPPPWRGWCHDRIMEPNRIDITVTANALEFLVKFREYLQFRINTTIRDVFQSYDPVSLSGIDRKLIPTDLATPYYEQRITAKLLTHVSNIRFLAARRHHAPSTSLEAPKIGMWSAIFYGPPGSSKTYLAKAKAHELHWPIVVLSPSDFLVQGEGYVEQHAKDIFTLLSRGSELVYFLDEIDELILAREYQQKAEQRNVFSFLTPSFLTKLQDLHDDAKKQLFVFFIGTNYFERIEPAAHRRGRIDEVFPVLYPDAVSRQAIAFEKVFPKSKSGSECCEADKKCISETIAQVTELQSYNGICAVCERVREKCKEGESANTIIGEIRGDDADSKKKLRPEIDLSIYHSRLAAHEELFAMLKLIGEKRSRTKALIRVLQSSDDKELQRFKDVVMEKVREESFSDQNAINKVFQERAHNK